ncbi:MAG: UDP-N-acetyl-D-glucosamine 2-epimerase, UDP-hydrolysing [Lentisphaerae bacterium GWF2_45_14]|nr:MAG: UDP-N-acetyl-D-glucosamine 2-epimerase, UDP-hydrolysing [Lentisphaerae bacterium GWF2_45_14]
MDKVKKRICVITGSRADYGLLCWVMKEIASRADMELVPVAVGAHLEPDWGYTVKHIESDGFTDVVKIKTFSGDTSACGIASTTAETVKGLSAFFASTQLDLVVLLGDRYEILAAAMAALIHNIPIAHLGGGEISEGVIDDSIRHALTKLSHLHFVITEKCAERVMAMGEESWRVHVSGSPRLDFMSRIKFSSKDELAQKLGIDFSRKIALVIFHPLTLENKNTEEQTAELIEALKQADCSKIMFYPNIDTNSGTIIKMLEEFAGDKENNAKIFKPLEMADYLGLLNSIDLMIGNSSAGIVESPSFKLPVVNIGDRQKGRDCMRNVIHVPNNSTAILKGIMEALSPSFKDSLKDMENIYGDGMASRKIADVISKIDFSKFSLVKKNVQKEVLDWRK